MNVKRKIMAALLSAGLLLLLLPAAFVLAVTTRSVEMVWLAFPIAEIVSVTLSALCLVHVYKKEIKNL